MEAERKGGDRGHGEGQAPLARLWAERRGQPRNQPPPHIHTREVPTESQAGRPESALTLTFLKVFFQPKVYLFPRSPH